MNGSKQGRALLSRAGVLAALAAGGLAIAGCAESSHGNQSTSGNVAGNQIGGPDHTGGQAQPGQVRTVSGTAIGAADDFAISNGTIVAALDAIGEDTSTTTDAFLTAALFKRNGTPGGAQMGTLIAPSGGNLIDLGLRGVNNDQLTVSGQAFVGLVGFTAGPTPILNNALNNLVLNFEVIPDGNPEALALGLRPSTDTRRLIVRGVVLGSSGTTNPVSGSTIHPEEDFIVSPANPTPATTQTDAGTIKTTFAGLLGAVHAASIPLPATVTAELELPQSFLDNIPDTFSLVTVDNTDFHALNAALPVLPVPLFVTTVYTIRQGSNYMQVTTVVTNGGSSSVAMQGMADLYQTGAFEKNVDILTPTILVPSRDVHVDTGTDGTPDDPASPETLFTGAPEGIAPWVTIIGRDEPGVSYTEFDPNVGQLVLQRQTIAFFGAVQASGGTLAAESSTIPWTRDIVVGNGNSAAASIDTAVEILAGAGKSITLPGASTPTEFPNPIVGSCILSGEVTGGGPEGGVVTIDELSPALALVPNPFAPGTEVFLPAGAITQVAGTPIRRTSARFGADGRWSAVVPAAYSIDASFAPAAGQFGALVAGFVGEAVSPASVTATYQITAFATGADNGSAPTAPVTVHAGSMTAPALTIATVATLSFSVLTAETAGGAESLSPAKLTFLGTTSTAAPDLSIPTGQPAVSVQARLAPQFPSGATIPVQTPLGIVPLTNAEAIATDAGEGFERTELHGAGAGNVYYTLRGSGSVRLPPGTYTVIASHGPEYTVDTETVVVGSSGASQAFHLTRAFTPPNARSGDFHVHSSPSPDSSVPFGDRLTAALGNDLEIVTATDHNNLNGVFGGFDEVAAQRPDVTSRLSVFTGVEATAFIGLPGLFTKGIGHYNAYPLRFDPSKRKNNAPEVEFRSPADLYANLRSSNLTPSASAVIVQMNHPRARPDRLPIGQAGLLENLSYSQVPSTTSTDPLAQAGADLSSATATATTDGGLDGASVFFTAFAALGADFRGSDDFAGVDGATGAHTMNAVAIDLLNTQSILPIGVAQGFPTSLEGPVSLLAGALDFDTLEVLNPTYLPVGSVYLDTRLDWFQLLNFGIIRTAVANTDIHRIGDRPDLVALAAIDALTTTPKPMGVSPFGYPRNYLVFPGGAPAAGHVDGSDLVTALGRSFADDATWHFAPTGVTSNPVEPVIAPLVPNGHGGQNICTTGPYIEFSVSGTNASSATVTGTMGDLVNLAGSAFTVNVHIDAAPWVPVDEIRVVIDGAVVFSITDTATIAAAEATTIPIGPLPYALLESNGVPVHRDFWLIVEAGETLQDIAANLTSDELAALGNPAYATYASVVPGGTLVTAFTNPVFIDRDNDGKFRAPADRPVTNP